MLSRNVQKKLGIVVFSVLVAGCVSAESELYDYGFVPSNLSVKEDKASLTNIDHVYVGMTRQEVISIMGESMDVGYVQKKNSEVEVLTLENPYKKEVLKKKDHKYEALYFFVSVKTPDGQISEDELMPLVFEKDRLVGKGYEFLSKIKR